MTILNPLPWLKHVKFRRSHRAKYLRIYVSSHDGVVVVMPVGVSRMRAQAFVKSESQWIERQLTQLIPASPPDPPETVALQALGRVLTVHTTTGQHGPARLHESNDSLYLSGAWQASDAWRDQLRGWLRKQAINILPNLLDKQATQMQISYRRLGIRLQRTRWGSCNRYGDISLNAKLLLLEPALLKHVLIHELAHILHFNHSSDFWSVVAKADPAWREHKRALRAATVQLPPWLEHYHDLTRPTPETIT